jgi:hypothetical protein
VIDNLNESILFLDGYRPLLCFDESTEILCLNENLEEVYLPISELKLGSFVKTFKHGFRRISTIYKNSLINNINDFHSCMYLMRQQENMTKDLIVTGGHSILVDNMTEAEFIKNSEYFSNTQLTIDDKQLLLAAASDNMTQAEFIKNSEYFSNTQLTLDDKQLLLAAASDKFTALENNNEYIFYNFCLENDSNDAARYGVWANGVLVETPSKQYLKETFCK